MMTPNLFIMSSGQLGRPVAEALAQLIVCGEAVYVDVWTAPEIFGEGEAFFDGLMRALLIYDFGLSILTPDDSLQKKGSEVYAARDNVLFESGLFIGGRGRQHALIVPVSFAGDAPDIPTDLKGYKTTTLELPYARGDASLNAETLLCCEPLIQYAACLRATILERYTKPSLSLLPSTGLAIGYFHNFVLPVLKSLMICPRIAIRRGSETEHIEVRVFKLVIRIPEDIDLATREIWAREANRRDFEEGVVDIPKGMELPRSYPFRLQVDRSTGDVTIHDLPTTLYSTKHIVQTLLSESRFSTPKHFQYAIERETHHFVNALKYLLNHSAYDSYRDLVHFEMIQTSHT